jgi:hypothetical protein
MNQAHELESLVEVLARSKLMPELVVIEHADARDMALVLHRRGIAVVIALPGSSAATSRFLDVFYTQLHNGESLVMAVRAAREESLRQGDKVGMQIECYGDANWRFHMHGGDIGGQHKSRRMRLLVTGIDEHFGWLGESVRRVFGQHTEIEFDFLSHDAAITEMANVFGREWPQLDRWDAILFFIGGEQNTVPLRSRNGLEKPSPQEAVYREATRQGKEVIGFVRSAATEFGEPASSESEIAFAEKLMREGQATRFHSRSELLSAAQRCVEQLKTEFASHGEIRQTLRPAAEAPDTVLASGHWVLVAGSGNKSALSKKLTITCKNLGQALALAGLKLVTGGWQGVDEAVARSFADELDRLFIPVDDRLLQVTPNNKSPAFKRGTVVQVQTGIAEYEECVKWASYLVMIGGHGGTERVATFAQKSGCTILPLADTGGDASRFHKQIHALEPDARQPLLDDEMVARLGAAAPEVGGTVVDLILDLQRTRQK